MQHNKTYIESLRNGIDYLLEKDEVFLIGEDVAEPYGGAFKVSKGLSHKYPSKVINMPMSEQSIAGMGIGMAMAGLKPIVEIMFGDFVTLTMDQILNHSAKFSELFDIPMHIVIRTPMGGYRGYGATHSQSLEKLYFGLPGVYVISPSITHEPGDLLVKSLNLGKTVLFVENKLDYTRKLLKETKYYNNIEINTTDEIFPINTINIKGENTNEAAIISYGGFTEPLIELQNKLFIEEEISIKLIIISQLSPIKTEEIYKLVKQEKKIIIAEEGHVPFGYGDTIISQLYQLGYRGEMKTIGAKNSIIYSADKLEKEVLPCFNELFKFIKEWN